MQAAATHLTDTRQKKNLLHNWDLAIEAYESFGCDISKDLKNLDFEKIDVTIRCHLIGELIPDAMNIVSESV